MIVLASASPRRAEILRTLGFTFEVDPADVDESVLEGESPLEHTRRLAEQKALAVFRRRPGDWVLAGDTVVGLDGRILGKPKDQDEAVSMLLSLQGRRHEVVSALALASPGSEDTEAGVLLDSETTLVTFRSFDRALASAYVATGEPLDKAGGYAIQERGAALVDRVEGDYSAVVGLPVPALLRLLGRAGRTYRFEG